MFTITEARAPMFTITEVMTASCAAHRVNGFVKKGDLNRYDAQPARANSTMLYDHFYGNNKLDITAADSKLSDDVIEYLKGLSFKAVERNLTDFEANTLKLVTAETINHKSLGIAASLPSVYLNKLQQDVWAGRENELAENSEYVGTLHQRGEFELTVENIRYIKTTGAYLYCCSESNKNIVKFFSDNELGSVGTVLYVAAYVKSHSVSKFHSGKETMINRVKELNK